jgi:hypothetical protein
MTEVDNRECERMEKLRQEIENARAAVNRAVGLVKGSKNSEVESWQLLEKLLDEARDLRLLPTPGHLTGHWKSCHRLQLTAAAATSLCAGNQVTSRLSACGGCSAANLAST